MRNITLYIVEYIVSNFVSPFSLLMEVRAQCCNYVMLAIRQQLLESLVITFASMCLSLSCQIEQIP